MRKWEEKYESLKNGEFDDRIDELKEKVDDKTATREEFKEYEKLTKSKANIDKIENILSYKEKLEKALKEVDLEILSRKAMDDLDKEKKELEAEMEKLEAKRDEIDSKLSGEKSEEKRAKLEQERKDVEGQIKSNNEAFAKNQKSFMSFAGRDAQLKDADNKKLNAMGLEISSRIKKCNMIAAALVDGKSFDTIDLKLADWKDDKKVYTPAKRTPKMEEVKEVKEELGTHEEGAKKENLFERVKKGVKSKVSEFMAEDKKPEEIEDEEIEDEEIDESIIDLDEIEELADKGKKPEKDKKPSVFSRIGNFFKNLINRRKESKALPEGKEDKKVIREEMKNGDEKTGNEESKTKKEKVDFESLRLGKSFRDELRELAEKGLDGLNEEEKASKKAKLDEFRKANGYRTGDTGGTMSQEGRDALNQIDEIADGFEK